MGFLKIFYGDWDFTTGYLRHLSIPAKRRQSVVKQDLKTSLSPVFFVLPWFLVDFCCAFGTMLVTMLVPLLQAPPGEKLQQL